MNTSKSLTWLDIKLATLESLAYIPHKKGEPHTFDLEELQNWIRAAIVEAVEGIYGDSDGLREFASTGSNQVVTSVLAQMHERKIATLEGQIKEITFLEEHRKRNHQISKERLKLRKASLKRNLRKLKEVVL